MPECVVIVYDEILPGVGQQLDQILVGPDTTVYGPYTQREAEVLVEHYKTAHDQTAQYFFLEKAPDA